jgi:hypothetical protein
VPVAFLLLFWPVAMPRAFAQGYTPAPMLVVGGFQSSCGQQADADIRSGVALLFLVEPQEARAAFERAEAAVPDCAVASWGVVLALLELPSTPPGESPQDRAVLALARARSGAIASDRERAYVETAARLIEPRASPYGSRLRAFTEAARALALKYPDDPHPVLLVALACLAQSTAPGDMGQREAATAIVLRMGESPSDPGAATLLVLARDNPSDAATARAAADLLVRTRPPSPRALQAAARVFHRIGGWTGAVAAGEAATELAGGPAGEWLLREGRWRDHPLPWLVQADAAMGRFAQARARLTAATSAFDAVAASLGPQAAWRLRALLDISWFRLRWAMVDWPAPVPWPDPDLATFASPTPGPPDGDSASDDDRALRAEASAVRAVVEGLVAARAAWPRGEPDRLAAARAAAASLDVHAADHAVPPRFELFATVVRVATSAAFEARDELALLEAHAASLERRVVEASTFAPLVVAADQLAGDAHLQLRDWREALWRFTALTAREPQNARAWLGAARAAHRLGDPAAAERAARFLAIWNEADADRPELGEARKLAKPDAPRAAF